MLLQFNNLLYFLPDPNELLSRSSRVTLTYTSQDITASPPVEVASSSAEPVAAVNQSGGGGGIYHFFIFNLFTYYLYVYLQTRLPYHE